MYPVNTSTVDNIEICEFGDPQNKIAKFWICAILEIYMP